MSTITITDRDLGHLLDAAGRCGEATGEAEGEVADLLDALTGLVPCDLAFWNWFLLDGESESAELVENAVVAGRRGTGPHRLPRRSWRANFAERPRMSGRTGHVTVIGDELTGRALEETGLHQEALVPSGLESEIGLELSHGRSEMNIVVLSRGPGPRFDERDRLVLWLVRPHVDAAIRRITRPPTPVSPRQLEVLGLVREGLTNGQVARRLAISERTVAKHLEHVFARTGARSRTQAVAMCADLLEAP